MDACAYRTRTFLRLYIITMKHDWLIGPRMSAKNISYNASNGSDTFTHMSHGFVLPGFNLKPQKPAIKKLSTLRIRSRVCQVLHEEGDL